MGGLSDCRRCWRRAVRSRTRARSLPGRLPADGDVLAIRPAAARADHRPQGTPGAGPQPAARPIGWRSACTACCRPAASSRVPADRAGPGAFGRAGRPPARLRRHRRPGATGGPPARGRDTGRRSCRPWPSSAAYATRPAWTPAPGRRTSPAASGCARRPPDRPVVLVDDLVTTGSSLTEAARVARAERRAPSSARPRWRPRARRAGSGVGEKHGEDSSRSRSQWRWVQGLASLYGAPAPDLSPARLGQSGRSAIVFPLGVASLEFRPDGSD